MRYILSTGKHVEVYFNHVYAEVPIRKYVNAPLNDGDEVVAVPTEFKPYKTVCQITVDGSVVTAEAVCAPCDNFCKEKGRRTAYNNLVKHPNNRVMSRIDLKDLLSKSERAELFNLVFPKYRKPKVENVVYREKLSGPVTQLKPGVQQQFKTAMREMLSLIKSIAKSK